MLMAIGGDEAARSELVFKGARILALRLAMMTRQSLDLDANLVEEIDSSVEGLRTKADDLKELLTQALARAAERETPVRYRLVAVTVSAHPREQHPRGWQGFIAALRLEDLRYLGTRGLPTLRLDLASYEPMGEGAIEPLAVDGGTVLAYSVVRQTAEKLRAFLQSAPRYRVKLARPGEAIRAKDLADLAAVLREHSAVETDFWDRVAAEFVIACQSRLVDCAGWSTFDENELAVSAAYRGEAGLSGSVTIGEAWDSLRSIVAELERRGIFPLQFPD